MAHQISIFFFSHATKLTALLCSFFPVQSTGTIQLGCYGLLIKTN